jgi:cytochrome P450
MGCSSTNCDGNSLAYAEMRLVLAGVLFNFDLELMPSQDDWLDQKVYGVWYKKPLMVRLRPVHAA